MSLRVVSRALLSSTSVPRVNRRSVVRVHAALFHTAVNSRANFSSDNTKQVQKSPASNSTEHSRSPTTSTTAALPPSLLLHSPLHSLLYFTYNCEAPTSSHGAAGNGLASKLLCLVPRSLALALLLFATDEIACTLEIKDDFSLLFLMPNIF